MGADCEEAVVMMFHLRRHGSASSANASNNFQFHEERAGTQRHECIDPSYAPELAEVCAYVTGVPAHRVKPSHTDRAQIAIDLRRLGRSSLNDRPGTMSRPEKFSFWTV